MKTVVGLVMLIVVVAGVAVRGSRAAPLPQDSVAFRQCQGGDSSGAERCRPAVDPLVLASEEGYLGDVAAGGYGGYGGYGGDGGYGGYGASAGDPDKWMEVARLAVMVADFVINNWDRLFGSSLSTGVSPAAAEVVFDPVR